MSVSHPPPPRASAFLAFFEKGDHRRFFTHSTRPSGAGSAFHIFLPPPSPHTHISRNSKLFSSVKRPSLLARKRGDSSGFYVFAPSSLRGAAPKMYTFVPYHDDDSYSNYNLNGQPDGCTQNTKDWREVIFASCVT